MARRNDREDHKRGWAKGARSGKSDTKAGGVGRGWRPKVKETSEAETHGYDAGYKANTPRSWWD